ncbi:pilus assembly protein TadG-related protein [Rhabdothermincola salaria]|uniref:pilus assembly protein TadG-related protein n=1 Tax=Rhabdothermincola salaria TaxID=2903142 RepID=UPI001E447FD1|nr:pilus assembly protein TadG-related protein [Rhabdothermincola salaria]MCD9623222.1 pilus assembly protein TadG-related protein [Rhabdothermincola salaria]
MITLARSGRARDDDGAVLVLMAGGLMVVVLLVAALAIDVAYARQERRQAQTSADAAALAAAQTFADGGSDAEAAEAARQIADMNWSALTSAAWSGCTVGQPDGYEVIGASTGSCVSVYRPGGVVRVVLPEEIAPSFFGGVVGSDGTDVTASAEAKWTQATTGDPGPCGICAIGGAWFQQDGNGNINSEDGRGVWADRLLINTNGNNNRPTTLVYGIQNESNNDKYTYASVPSGAPYFGRVPNPFEHVTVDYTGVTMGTPENAGCDDLVPDKMWNQKVNLSGNCTLTESGNYYFRRGLQVSGSLKSAAGARVTLIFGCAGGNPTAPTKCEGAHTGNFDVSGSLQLDEPYHMGVSILWDETAVGASVFNKDGNGNVKLGGAYYSKNATPSINRGNFEATALVFGGDGLYGNQHSSVIKITAPSGGTGGGGTGGGSVSLYR